MDSKWTVRPPFLVAEIHQRRAIICRADSSVRCFEIRKPKLLDIQCFPRASSGRASDVDCRSAEVRQPTVALRLLNNALRELTTDREFLEVVALRILQHVGEKDQDSLAMVALKHLR